MIINGNTELIAHIGFPTHAFKAPMIYNPWFEKAGVNAVVVPMGCRSDDYATFLRSVFQLANIRGALITMPHKVVTTTLLDEVLPTAAIAGACNAVRRLPDGRLQGDMFDGEGFVRGVLRKGRVLRGARVLVVGCGGVGSGSTGFGAAICGTAAHSSASMPASFSSTLPCVMKSMSSSGKSRQASTKRRRSIMRSRRAWMRCENSPESERTALRAASSVAALMTSATASA